MMNCSKCGKENPDSAKFCSSCGNQFGIGEQNVGSTTKPQSKWKYNFWKDPNVGKTDKTWTVIYIISTLFMPLLAVIWLIVVWFVRGKKLPLIYKQFISIALILGSVGASMAWYDAHKAATTEVISQEDLERMNNFRLAYMTEVGLAAIGTFSNVSSLVPKENIVKSGDQVTFSHEGITLKMICPQDSDICVVDAEELGTFIAVAGK